MVCGSGLYSVILAAQAIGTAQADCIIAGGQESMSNAPFLLPHLRRGRKLGDAAALDSVIVDGLFCALKQYHMGVTAENIAQKYSISRVAQDAYALRSHQRAKHATEKGYFKDEMLLLGTHDCDEQIRNDIHDKDLAKLKPVFAVDGTVTAGNASGINDGAAAVLLSSEKGLTAPYPAGANRRLWLLWDRPRLYGYGSGNRN